MGRPMTGQRFIAPEIADDLEAALEPFATNAEGLKK